MSNIFFSVVIPSYNQKSFLKKGIDSVLRQSYKKFEILVIDNNSTDGSQEYIQNLGNNKIKLILGKKMYQYEFSSCAITFILISVCISE